jgi:hypothetical protein
MKHDWNYRWDWEGDHRCCRNCGAEQQKVTHHVWGRVTGKQYLPLVGRCKPNEAAKEAFRRFYRGAAS